MNISNPVSARVDPFKVEVAVRVSLNSSDDVTSSRTDCVLSPRVGGSIANDHLRIRNRRIGSRLRIESLQNKVGSRDFKPDARFLARKHRNNCQEKYET